MTIKDPSFLAEMRGVSMDPGRLETLGKSAAALAETGDLSLTEAVVQTIGKIKLNAAHVRRVVEFANQTAFERKYASMDPSMRVVDIEGGPADPVRVLQDLNDGARPSHTVLRSNDYMLPPLGDKDVLVRLRAWPDLGRQLGPAGSDAGTSSCAEDEALLSSRGAGASGGVQPLPDDQRSPESPGGRSSGGEDRWSHSRGSDRGLGTNQQRAGLLGSGCHGSAPRSGSRGQGCSGQPSSFRGFPGTSPSSTSPRSTLRLLWRVRTSSVSSSRSKSSFSDTGWDDDQTGPLHLAHQGRLQGLRCCQGWGRSWGRLLVWRVRA